MGKTFHVYILASDRNGTLYTGVTNDLTRRMLEHEQGGVEGFTQKYNVKKLVYYEEFPDAVSAIHREKCIKKWRRAWKLKTIEGKNPDWKDLAADLLETMT